MPFGNVIQRRVPMLFAGKLRQRIDIVTVSNVQDSTGGFNLSTDVVYANVWASVEPVQGGDKNAAGSIVAINTLQVVIRYIGAAPSWQPVYDYAGQMLVVDANLNLQQAQSSGGLSGVIAPVWNQTAGGFTTDGDPSTGVTWKNLGPAPKRTGVHANMQVWFGGRQFQITSVLNPVEYNKMLVLNCVEINDSLQQTAQLPA
jgi:head-tail adaptor